MLCMPSLFQMGLEVTGPWLMQLLLVAKPPHGVVGVAAVRLDEVWRCHSCRAGLGSQGKGTSYVNGKSTQWMISIDF